tara:strand:- start:5245 stop:6813 length:1569 start_codon:yes stop_codon:yes gene_type:complete
MANPAAARHEIERMKCEGSLYEFVRAGWHTLHPGTEFVGGWAIKTMCAHLEAVTRGDITRLLINVPPGCTKSMLVNVFWPCWEWGPKGLSHYKYIATAHEKGLVIDLMARAREVLKSEWYQSHWPLTFKADADGKEYYATTGQGSRFAGSVTSKLTGRRGHRFIIDDPHSVASAESDTERTTAGNWFTETTPTRFDDQENPVYVIIMQRLHMMDISGIVIKELASKGQDWTHVCLPMEFEEKYRSWSCVPSTHGQPKMMRRVLDDGEPLPYYVEDEENGILLWPQDPRQVDGDLLWPERFSRKAIEELKVQFRAVGGSYAEAAQLQQRPVPRGGGMFDRANFVFVDECPELIAECRGYDLAATDDNKAAWTVGAKVGRTRSGQIVIADVDRYRKGPGDVETAVLSCAIRDGVNCPISIPQDPGQAGKSQVRAFAALLNGYNARFSPESGSKENRAIPLAAQVEAGNVLIVRGPWNDAFLAEAGLFPNSQFKDQVDAITRAYDYLLQNAGPKLALTPGKMIQY